MHWKAPSYATVPKAISRNQYTALCTRAVGSRCKPGGKTKYVSLNRLEKPNSTCLSDDSVQSNHFTPLDSVCHMPDAW